MMYFCTFREVEGNSRMIQYSIMPEKLKRFPGRNAVFLDQLKEMLKVIKVIKNDKNNK